ncbi:hypothetical protein K227x_24650 [Rubripirellula lacrimiformis]|uniref:AAA+ ATPase domain-containing protein n=1 Tax=Rubripirellula lacrimiformis TaxID=1930273 RepID=A0A517NAB7_9BACT|nr:hypothetical protein [Rubripirellula lacrimiformis]QDT04077.1 hypothetical protein K227x_24650 [Rubripirellula lacrimiformis]
MQSIAHRLLQHSVTAVVGPHGTGKSTLLTGLVDMLRPQFPAIASVQLCNPECTGWLRRHRHRRSAARTAREAQTSLASGGWLIVDGAEQLSRQSWSRLCRRICHRGQTLLATSHQPLPGAIELHRTGNSAELIRSLTDDLIAGATMPIAPATRNQIDGELRARQLAGVTNVRDLWFDLYDIVQSSHLSGSDR